MPSSDARPPGSGPEGTAATANGGARQKRGFWGRWRRTLHHQLYPKAWRRHGLSPVNRFVCLAILASALLACLETEPLLTARLGGLFRWLEFVFAVIFLVEYALRVWTAGERPQYAGLRGRLRYMLTPVALTDLAAVLPILLFFGWDDVALVRVFRLLRILLLARLGRFSHAAQDIIAAVTARRYELWVSLMVASMLLVTSSTLLYLVEGQVQPEHFGSIPRAMWWSIVTLTTVDYGDVTPVTPLGRFFAAVTALTGIGLIAMPTGILAAAFSEVIQRRREREEAERR